MQATATAHFDAPTLATQPRLDLYTPIHKALRAYMSDTLVRLGQLDPADDEQRERVLDQVDALLLEMRNHLAHENDFVHTALEARNPGSASRTASDHVGHVEAISNLEDESRALRDARPEYRGPLALSLYRHLGGFIAENLEHMAVEERENNAALWASYSDAELMGLHEMLLASIPPAELAQTMRWFVVALSVTELAQMFGGMKAHAPRPAFEAMFDIARTYMDQRRFGQLARVLSEPAAPGLMSA
jgi:hypothetical protein